MTNKKILVTGGAGFIGSFVCELLLAENYEVYCIDNFNNFYSPEQKKNNLANCLVNNKFYLIEGDILDDKLLEEVFANQFEAVIHLAALAGVRPSIKHPELYTKVNVEGTLRLLEKSKQTRAFIFASSSSIYGNNKQLPFSEIDNVDFPISPYAATKKAGELLCHTYHHLYKLPVICLRFFTVVGPRQRPDLALHNFTQRIFNDLPIDVYGDGSSGRDYTYVLDVAKGVLSALNYALAKNCYEIINIGNAHMVRLKNFIELIERKTGKEAVKNYLPIQDGDVDYTYANPQKAADLLGFRAQTSIEQAVADFVDWYKATILP